MATATLTETPEEILVWMKKFGFDARSMKQKDNDDSKKLAEDVARLLNELQSLPNYKDLLKRFSEIGDTWKWGTELLEQYKQGQGDHDTRVSIRKGMREVLTELKKFKGELENAQKPIPTGDLTDELRKEFGTVTINQSIIADQVTDGGPGDELAAESLTRRAEIALKAAEDVIEPGENNEEEEALVLHRKLALAGLRVVAQDQQSFLASLKNDTAQVRAQNAVQSELAGLYTTIESNIKFARKAPLRDDVLVKINECEVSYNKARKNAQRHASKEEMDKIQVDLKTLKDLVVQSRGLMSNQAIGLQAAAGVPPAQRECDSRLATANTSLNRIEADLVRIKQVNPGFDDKAVDVKIANIRQALGVAKNNAYGRFEKVIKNQTGDDVLTPMREDFNLLEEQIANVRADVNTALQDADQVALKANDLKPLLTKALLAPEIIPGRKDLQADFDKLLDKSNKSPSSEKLFQLGVFKKRCEEIIAASEEGTEEGGPNYWTKKEQAAKAIEAEKKELEKAKKTIGERSKLASAALAEAELHFNRDDEPGFDQVQGFIDISKNIRTTKLDNPSLAFEKARIRALPMITSARTIDPAISQRYDNLVKQQPHTELEVKALGKLYDEAAKVVRPEYRKWDQAVSAAAKKAQFLIRLRDLKEDGSAPLEQQKQVELRKKDAEKLLTDYDNAVRQGDRGEYSLSLTALGDFMIEAEKLEKKLNDEAAKVLDSAKKPVDAQGNPLKNSQGEDLTWSGPTAQVKDQAYGFNTNRDAMRYTAGQEMTLDGTLIVSNELDDIAKFLDFKLKKFRELCNLGQDPLTIARHVFDPVEENFWPPEAVRVVAVFRAASQEFEEERLRKEAKELGLNPDKSVEVDEIRNQIEAAKKNQVPAQGLKAINAQMLKEGGKFVLEEGSEDAEKLGQLLGLANFWTKTDNFGVGEIGKFKTTNEEGEYQANKPVGYAGDFIELGADVIKVGMSAKEALAAYLELKEEKEKRDFKARKEDQKISPVKKRILEYERNRALATLLNNLTDTVLNAISAGGHVPGFNIAGDVKALALAAMEAGRYFEMLANTLALKQGSENDPDSITYLGLARQAEEEGIAGGRKCFECAMKILKLTGDVVQLCGHAAPAGFAINATSQFLELSGNACFKVYDWHDASTQNKHIKKAQQKPPDYQSIAEVFSNTRKYARFCIAWGCLHNDSWARSYVMSRGLTDSDLDNSETSTAIIRQYINVTQESLLGKTQNEDPETFGDSVPGQMLTGMKNAMESLGGAISDKVLDKVNDRNRDIKSQYFEYKVDKDALTFKSWDATLILAYNPGGLLKTGEVMKLGKLFKQLETEHGLVSPAATDPGKEATDKKFRQLSQACQAAFDELGGALSAYEPTANPKGKKPHQCMKMYLGDLLVEISKQSAALSKMRDEYEKSSYLIRAGGNQDAAKKLQEEENAAAEKKRRQQVADFDTLRSDTIDERLLKTEFETLYGKFKLGDPAGREKLLAEALKRLELQQAPSGVKDGLKQTIEKGYEDLNYRLFMALSGLKPDIAEDGAMSLSKEFDTQFKLQCKVAGAEFAAKLKKACADAVADPVGQYTFNKDHKFPTPFDAAGNARALISGGAKFWNDGLVAAANPVTGGWVKDAMGQKIANTITTFAEVNYTLRSMLKANQKDLNTQSKWRVKLTKLKGRVESLPCATKYGTDHPGMADLRDRFLAQLNQREQEMNREMNRVNQTVDWLPPVSFFDAYFIKASVHKNIVALCKAHLFDPKSDSKAAAGLFGACDYAQGYWQAVEVKPENFSKAEAEKRAGDYEKALTALKQDLEKIKPVYAPKHPRHGEPHDGMVAYITSVTRRIGDGSSGAIKTLKESLASNAAKYKT